jgi:hypothetical protein
MPRALEILDVTLRRIEQGEIDGIEAIDDLLAEELSVRENSRVRAALAANTSGYATAATIENISPTPGRARVAVAIQLLLGRGDHRRQLGIIEVDCRLCVAIVFAVRR